MEVLEPSFYNTRRGALGKDRQFTTTNAQSSSSMQSQICELYSHDSIASSALITDVQWQHTQEDIDFKPKVVDTLSYINGSSYPVDKTIYFSWSVEEEQSTTWSQRWSSGEKFEYEAKLPGSDFSLKITYNHMCNTSTTLVILSSEKSLQVSMSPRKTIVAHLVLLASEVLELPFIATVKCAGVNESYNEQKIKGSWRGILYKLSSSDINVFETELGIM